MDYTQVHSYIGPYKIDNKSKKYNIEYQNIYNYNNYTSIIIILFIILLIIYLFVVYRKIN
jgi:hypothetical protein